MKKASILLFVTSLILFGFTINEKRKASVLPNQKMVHIGIVVEDIEVSAKKWTEFLGLEEVPRINTSGHSKLCPTQFNGEASDAKVKMAFFNFDNIKMELMEPVGDDSSWKDFLDTNGPGVHHMAFDVDDMEVSVKDMELEGMELLQKGGWNTGEYGYLSGEDMGVIIELLEHYK